MELTVNVTQEHIDMANLIREYWAPKAGDEYLPTMLCPIALAVRLTGRPGFHAYLYRFRGETYDKAVEWDNTMKMTPFTATVYAAR